MNSYFFGIVSSGFNTKLSTVVFAEPRIDRAKSSIDWFVNLEFESIRTFPELDRSLKQFVRSQLEEARSICENVLRTKRDVDKDFVKSVFEVPYESSIKLVTAAGRQFVVVTEWGFIEDNPKSNVGAYRNIVEQKPQSLLVKVISRTKTPVAGIVVGLEVLSENRDSRNVSTDENGLARFSDLYNNESVRLFARKGEFADRFFEVGENPHYTVEVDLPVNLKFRFRTVEGEAWSSEGFEFVLGEHEQASYETDSLGRYEIEDLPAGVTFQISSDALGLLHEDTVPNEDGEIEIILDSTRHSVGVGAEVDINEFAEVKLLNWRKGPLVNHGFTVENTSGHKLQFTTDELGVARVPLDSLGYGGKINTRHWGSDFNFIIHNNPRSGSHVYRCVPIIPYWWIAGTAGICFLLCCLFCTRSCASDNQKGGSAAGTGFGYEDRVEEVPSNFNPLPCDIETVSGGYGVTKSIHELGNVSGIVEFRFRTYQIKDKISVFVGSAMVWSTSEILDDHGFVSTDSLFGGNSYGVVEFYFDAESSDRCMVVVEGGMSSEGSTEWDYIIGCPY